MTATFNEDVRFNKNVTFGGTRLPLFARSELEQETGAVYELPLENFRVFDAYATLLPGTPATDDLGLVGGTHGTNVPSLQTEDLKAAGSTDKKARTTFTLPPEYQDGETVTLRFSAGMLTTVSDGTATIDVVAYKFGVDTAITGADLVNTVAQSINSLTFSNIDFTLTPTTLNAGDKIDILVTMNVNDSGSATAVKGAIAYAEMRLDVKG